MKYLQLLLLLLLMTPLTGQVIDDPAAALWYQRGIFCEGKPPITVALGLVDTVVSDAHLKIDTADRGSISKTLIESINARLSVFAFNRITWDLLLGTSRIEITSTEKPFLVAPAIPAPLDLFTSTGFSWGTDIKGILYTHDFATLGFNCGYFQALPELNDAELASRLYVENNRTNYQEWYAAGLASIDIEMVPKKVALIVVNGVFGKWKRYSLPNVPISSVARLFDMVNERVFGYCISGSILFGEEVSLSFEHRFLCERSNSAMILIRF